VVEIADVRYARRGSAHIAYHVVGDGDIDLLAIGNGTTVWMDQDDEPHLRRFDRRLASFSRLIRFDPSGFGLSDPLVGATSPTIEGWMHDALAVLDAVGSSRASLFGVGEGGLAAILFSATYPERTSALVLMHCYARLVRGGDYPWGVPQHVVDRFFDATANPDYTGESVDDVAVMAPSCVGDVDFRSWWKSAGQRSASPAIARAMTELMVRADLRSVLPAVNVPTLVVQRVDNAYVRIAQSRFLVEQIAGAELLELSGHDHLAFVGETDELLGGIEEFLTGSRAAVATDRVLATILFTDIVDSTQRAADSGDRRWRDLLDSHDAMTSRQVRRFGGRPVKTTGDGILATFDGPAQAVRCGLAISDGARQLGLDVRVGLHTAEVERRGDDIAGIGVHIASRIQAEAEAGAVWVSRTVTELVTGSGIAFTDRGEHELKGVPGIWQLFAVEG
jgi:class 3 adenylate cyclase